MADWAPTMAPDDPHSASCYDGSIGPRIIGAHLSTMLVGVIILQTLCYFRSANGRQDSRFLRGFVLMLSLLALGHNICAEVIIFEWSTKGGAACAELEILSFVALLIAFLVATLGQLWLLHRVLVVSERNWWAVGFGLLLWFTTLTCCVVTFVLFVVHAGTRWTRGMTVGIPLIGFLSAGTQLYGALAFVFFATRRRKTVHDVRLGSLLKSLATLTLQACLLPALSSLLLALFIIAAPTTSAYAAPFAVMPLLYCISVLFTLNSRAAIQTKADREGAMYTIPSLPNLDFVDRVTAFSCGQPLSPSVPASSSTNGDSESCSSPRTPKSHTFAAAASEQRSGLVGLKSIDYIVEVEQRVDRIESLDEEDGREGMVDPRLYHAWAEPDR